jgi:hypothetical protein
MFEWFKRRGLGPAAGGAERCQYAPGTRIAYDPRLVARLTGEHRMLRDGLGRVRELAIAHRLDQLGCEIRRYHRALARHLLAENVLLYTYLAHCLKGAPAPAGIVRGMHDEMACIGRAAAAFFERHARTGVDADRIDAFLLEFERVAATLIERIEREEASLYPLYRSPGSYRPPAPAGPGPPRR